MYVKARSVVTFKIMPTYRGLSTVSSIELQTPGSCEQAAGRMEFTRCD